MTPMIEVAVRLACFVGVLLVMAIWEVLAPRRKLTASKPLRWTSNLALSGINSLLARVILPLSAVATAELAASSRWGLLNRFSWPPWLEFLIAVIVLDLTMYLQHVMSHAVPAFWKVHQVHHADLDFDVTTGLRFHTAEILLSMVLKIVVVAAIGPQIWGVLTFELLLNATSMFNHSNVRIPVLLERCMRLLVVTPEMHRVHHSVIPTEANSNFGFNLPWWDYLLGTYRDQPADGHERMQIGLRHLRDEQQVERLPGMLALPFRSSAGEYTICGRNGASSDNSDRSAP
jgi:sterol desaturase/sphingolipid hydroxylase (fatty acid hydroxylase superfamily)